MATNLRNCKLGTTEPFGLLQRLPTLDTMDGQDHNLSQALSDLLVAEARKRICLENIPRVKKCLGILTAEQIWHRPNESLVSVGNLVLHLHGNARQWILQTLCGMEFVRDRDREFAERGPLAPSVLIELLDRLDADLQVHLVRITPRILTKEHAVQVFQENGVGVLVHAIEHFSYHTGQIARETKRFLSRDLGFYGGLEL